MLKVATYFRPSYFPGHPDYNKRHCKSHCRAGVRTEIFPNQGETTSETKQLQKFRPHSQIQDKICLVLQKFCGLQQTDRLSTTQARSTSRSIPGVFQETFAFFHHKTHLYGIKKVYSIVGYVNKNFIIFDYCKQYMTETQSWMKCTGFLRLRQIQFKELSWIYLPFLRIGLNNANMKNYSIPG